MNKEPLTDLLTQAEADIEISENVRAEELCNHVLEALSRSTDDDVVSRQLLTARALRLLSESFARRRRGADALPIGEKALAAAKEVHDQEEEAKAIANLGYIYHLLIEFDRALNFCNTSVLMFRHLGDTRSEARTLNVVGQIYTSLGTYDQALEYTTQALTLYEKINNKQGIIHATGNIGIVYEQLSDHQRAREYFTRTLQGHTELGNRAGIAGTLCNIGNTYVSVLDYSSALDFYKRALSILEEIDNQGFIAVVLNNISALQFRIGDYANLFEQYNRVLAIREKIGDKLGASEQIANIGELYGRRDFEGYDPIKAEEYLLRGLAQVEESGAKHAITGSLKMVADFYKSEKRWEEFAQYFERYHDLEKEVLNEKSQRALELMEQRRQAIEQEKVLAEERARAQATEELLHKTLPSSIANRVIQGEVRIADHFENVSILFADIVGFTQLSAQLPPAVVLDFMNFIFEHFDALAAKHGCERIKTVGDGYIAVCGAPILLPDHGRRIAVLALDMMKDIFIPDTIRHHLPAGTSFHLRIGIHCGAITAGLIGTGKLAYDIYGDAVNLASRMESSGVPGRIHCSSDFAQHLLGSQNSFAFEERGEIEIKGKGTMTTYFLEMP